MRTNFVVSFVPIRSRAAVNRVTLNVIRSCAKRATTGSKFGGTLGWNWSGVVCRDAGRNNTGSRAVRRDVGRTDRRSEVSINSSIKSRSRRIGFQNTGSSKYILYSMFRRFQNRGYEENPKAAAHEVPGADYRAPSSGKVRTLFNLKHDSCATLLLTTLMFAKVARCLS